MFSVSQCCLCTFLNKSLLFTDLEDVLHQAGIGRNSPGLTYSGLRQIFGTSTPSARTMECFDSDWDQKYSLKELRAALGLWAHYHWQQWTVLEYPAGSGDFWDPDPVLCNCCTFLNWIFIILIVEQWRWHALPLLTPSPSRSISTQPFFSPQNMSLNF